MEEMCRRSWKSVGMEIVFIVNFFTLCKSCNFVCFSFLLVCSSRWLFLVNQTHSSLLFQLQRFCLTIQPGDHVYIYYCGKWTSIVYWDWSTSLLFGTLILIPLSTLKVFPASLVGFLWFQVMELGSELLHVSWQCRSHLQFRIKIRSFLQSGCFMNI